MSGVTAAIDSLGLEIIIPALLLLVAVLPFLLNANRNQALGLLAAPFLLALGLGYLKYQADHTAAASEGELLSPPHPGSAQPGRRPRQCLNLLAYLSGLSSR